MCAYTHTQKQTAGYMPAPPHRSELAGDWPAEFSAAGGKAPCEGWNALQTLSATALKHTKIGTESACHSFIGLSAWPLLSSASCQCHIKCARHGRIPVFRMQELSSFRHLSVHTCLNPTHNTSNMILPPHVKARMRSLVIAVSSIPASSTAFEFACMHGKAEREAYLDFCVAASWRPLPTGNLRPLTCRLLV